jgi:hypothetical protein
MEESLLALSLQEYQHQTHTEIIKKQSKPIPFLDDHKNLVF